MSVKRPDEMVCDDCGASCWHVPPESRRRERKLARLRAPFACVFATNHLYRSISPMTMSSEPTIAGTSAIRHPRQSALVTDKLQKLLLRALARQGIDSPLLTR